MITNTRIHTILGLCSLSVALAQTPDLTISRDANSTSHFLKLSGSWHTADSGRYARIWATQAQEATARGTATGTAVSYNLNSPTEGTITISFSNRAMVTGTAYRATFTTTHPVNGPVTATSTNTCVKP